MFDHIKEYFLQNKRTEVLLSTLITRTLIIFGKDELKKKGKVRMFKNRSRDGKR